MPHNQNAVKTPSKVGTIWTNPSNWCSHDYWCHTTKQKVQGTLELQIQTCYVHVKTTLGLQVEQKLHRNKH